MDRLFVSSRLFLDTKPVLELKPPPTLPSWLFSTRARRFPFRISQTEEGDDGTKGGAFLGGRYRSTAPRRRRGKRRRRKDASSGASSYSGSSVDSTASSDSSSAADDSQSSPFEDLEPIIRSRKRRLQKRTTIPHIHRSACKYFFVDL